MVKSSAKIFSPQLYPGNCACPPCVRSPIGLTKGNRHIGRSRDFYKTTRIILGLVWGSTNSSAQVLRKENLAYMVY